MQYTVNMTRGDEKDFSELKTQFHLERNIFIKSFPEQNEFVKKYPELSIFENLFNLETAKAITVFLPQNSSFAKERKAAVALTKTNDVALITSALAFATTLVWLMGNFLLWVANAHFIIPFIVVIVSVMVTILSIVCMKGTEKISRKKNRANLLGDKKTEEYKDYATYQQLLWDNSIFLTPELLESFSKNNIDELKLEKVMKYNPELREKIEEKIILLSVIRKDFEANAHLLNAHQESIILEKMEHMAEQLSYMISSAPTVPLNKRVLDPDSWTAKLLAKEGMEPKELESSEKFEKTINSFNNYPMDEFNINKIAEEVK